MSVLFGESAHKPFNEEAIWEPYDWSDADVAQLSKVIPGFESMNPLDQNSAVAAMTEGAYRSPVVRDGTQNSLLTAGSQAKKDIKFNQMMNNAMDFDFNTKYLQNRYNGMDEVAAWAQAQQDMAAQAAPQMSSIGPESKECRDAWNGHLDQDPYETRESPTDEWCWENQPNTEYDPLREQSALETFLLGKNLKAERMRDKAKGNADYLLGDEFSKDYEDLEDDPSGAHFGLSDFVVPGLYPGKVAYYTAKGDYQPGVLDILGFGGGVNMARRAVPRWKQLADNAMASFGARNIHTPWDAATQLGREAKSGFMNSRIGPGSIDVYSPEGRLLESVRKEDFHTPVDETALPWSR